MGRYPKLGIPVLVGGILLLGKWAGYFIVGFLFNRCSRAKIFGVGVTVGALTRVEGTDWCHGVRVGCQGYLVVRAQRRIPTGCGPGANDRPADL